MRWQNAVLPNDRDFITAAEFAAAAGVHPGTVNEWHRQHVGPERIYVSGLGGVPCYRTRDAREFLIERDGAL